MARITVYPTKPSTFGLEHPTDGAIDIAGSQWTQDGFTSRLISDKLLTVDQAKGYRGPPLSLLITPAHPASGSTAGPKS